jgi:hypothetical protein
MKYNILLLTLCLLSFFNSSFCQNKLSSEVVVQLNLDSYNKRDIDGFMRSFSDSSDVYRFGESIPLAAGRDEIRKLYEKLFNSSPNLHSKIAHRTTLGNKIIDHELITGRNGDSQVLELVVIYEVENDLIKRMTIIR